MVSPDIIVLTLLLQLATAAVTELGPPRQDEDGHVEASQTEPSLAAQAPSQLRCGADTSSLPAELGVGQMLADYAVV